MFKKFFKPIAIIGLSCVALTAAAYDFDSNGIYYTVLSFTDHTCEVSGINTIDYANISDLTIPETVIYDNTSYDVTAIGKGAFRGNKNIGNIILPNSIQKLGGDAFRESSLAEISLSENITYIPGGCFYGCKFLKHIELPQSVTAIYTTYGYNFNYTGAFEASGIESIELHDNIKKIDIAGFRNCGALSSVRLSTSLSQLPKYSFQGTANLKSIAIPNNITSIEENAFANSGLEDLSIGDNETPLFREISIYNNAFSNCKRLKAIRLISNIKYLFESSFSGCDAIREIESYLPVAPEILDKIDGDGHIFVTNGDNTFTSLTFLDGVLKVPVGSESSYKNTRGWKNFVHIDPVITNINEVYSYVVNVNIPSGHGRVLIDGKDKSEGIAYSDKPLTFKFLPETGYEVVSTVLNDEDVTEQIADGILTLNNISSDITLDVQFANIQIPLSITMGEEGKLQTFVNHGTSLVVNITATDGWEINTVGFNGVDVTHKICNEGKFTTPQIIEPSEIKVSYKQSGSDISDTMESISKISILPGNGMITINGASDSTVTTVYTIDGRQIIKTTDQAIALPNDNVYIIDVNNQRFKVAL